MLQTPGDPPPYIPRMKAEKNYSAGSVTIVVLVGMTLGVLLAALILQGSALITVAASLAN